MSQLVSRFKLHNLISTVWGFYSLPPFLLHRAYEFPLLFVAVAAGGGSRLYFRSGSFVVGPESAGAHPGPACYRKGGPATVTDANVVLDRLLPQYFPKVFGTDERQALDVEASFRVLQALADQVNLFERESKGVRLWTVADVALGFVHVANEVKLLCNGLFTHYKKYIKTTPLIWPAIRDLPDFD